MLAFVVPANEAHIRECDLIARECEALAKGSLGWVRRDSMFDAISKGTMNVALSFASESVRGFVIWSKPSRGANTGWHVVHTLAVDVLHQREGIGEVLLNSVPLPIRLKCPVEVGGQPSNSANLFYAKMDFKLMRLDTTKGGKLLNVWEKRE